MREQYETKRLRLSLSSPALAEEVLDYLLRNRDFLAPTEPERGPDYFTPEYQRAELERAAARAEARTGYRFWISPLGQDKIIGMVGLNEIVWGAFESCFLSYRLDEAEVGKGYATEAVGKVVEIAFLELGLHRIEANIMPRNRASLRVVEKLGFRGEGRAAKYLKIGGVWEDHIHMVRLREDYP